MSKRDDANQAITQGLADLRAMIEETTRRFEAEIKRFDMSGVFGSDRQGRVPSSAQEAVADMERLAEYLRTEASTVAADVTESIADVVDEVSRFIVATFPGAESGVETASRSVQRLLDPSPAETADSGDTPTTPSTGTVAKASAKKAGAKKSAKKAGAKKSAKKAGAKKAGAKKSAKKAGAKKAGAKKSAKKAGAKKSAKKAGAKKAGAKKAGAKKAGAKKAGAKKAGAKKAGAKKSAKKAGAKKST